MEKDNADENEERKQELKEKNEEVGDVHLSLCGSRWCLGGKRSSLRSGPHRLSSDQIRSISIPHRKPQVIFSPRGWLARDNKWHNAWGLYRQISIVSSRELLPTTRQQDE